MPLPTTSPSRCHHLHVSPKNWAISLQIFSFLFLLKYSLFDLSHRTGFAWIASIIFAVLSEKKSIYQCNSWRCNMKLRVQLKFTNRHIAFICQIFKCTFNALNKVSIYEILCTCEINIHFNYLLSRTVMDALHILSRFRMA